MDSRVPVSGVGVSSRNGEEDSQLAPLQAISLVATRLLRSAQEGRPVEEKAPMGGGGEDESSIGRGARVFLMWTPGMFTSGHFLCISATGVVGGCPEWPISGHTD